MGGGGERGTLLVLCLGRKQGPALRQDWQAAARESTHVNPINPCVNNSAACLWWSHNGTKMAQQRHHSPRRRDDRRESSYPWDVVAPDTASASDFSDLTWSDGLPAFFEEAQHRHGAAEELVQSVMADLLLNSTQDDSNEHLQQTVDAFYKRYSAKQRAAKLKAIIAREPADDRFANFMLWSSLAASAVIFLIFYFSADAYEEHSAIFAGSALTKSLRSNSFSFAQFFTIGTCLSLVVQEAKQWAPTRLLQGKGRQRGQGQEQGQSGVMPVPVAVEGGEEEEKEETHAPATGWLPPLSFPLTRLLILLVVLVPAIVIVVMLAEPSRTVNAEAFFVVSNCWQYSAIAAIGLSFCLKHAAVVPRALIVATFHTFNVGVIVQVWAIMSRDYERRIAPYYAILTLEMSMYAIYVWNLLRAVKRGDFNSPVISPLGMLNAEAYVVLGINAMFIMMISLVFGMSAVIRTLNMRDYAEFTCCWLVYAKTISVVFLAAITSRVANLDYDSTRRKFRNMLAQESGGAERQEDPGGRTAVGTMAAPEPEEEGEGRSGPSGGQNVEFVSSATTAPVQRCWQETAETSSNGETQLA